MSDVDRDLTVRGRGSTERYRRRGACSPTDPCVLGCQPVRTCLLSCMSGLRWASQSRRGFGRPGGSHAVREMTLTRGGVFVTFAASAWTRAAPRLCPRPGRILFRI